MAYNKITLNGETKIDLTQDTATAEDVLLGKTFHLNSGEEAVGTLEITSGGGSEEDMKIESEVHYGSANMTTFYNRVRELIQNNKLLYVKLLIGAVRSSSAKTRVILNTAGEMSFSNVTGIMRQIPYFYYPAAMGDDFITLAGKSSNTVNSSLYLKSGTYVMWYANGFYFTETSGITMDYMSASLNGASDEFTIYYFE